jgi:hypothetical protein
LAKLDWDKQNRNRKVNEQGAEYAYSYLPKTGSLIDIKNNSTIAPKKHIKKFVTCPRCHCKIDSEKLKNHIQTRCPKTIDKQKSSTKKNTKEGKNKKPLIVKDAIKMTSCFKTIYEEILSHMRKSSRSKISLMDLVDDIGPILFVSKKHKTELLYILLSSMVQMGYIDGYSDGENGFYYSLKK